MNAADSKDRRKSIVRTTIALIGMALAVYGTFILLTVLRA